LFFIFRKNLARVWPIIFALAFVIFSLIYPLSEHNNIYPPSPQIINYQADFACRDLKDIRGAVWKIARQNFFFGQGPNSFAASYRIFQSSQWSRSKFAFNEYLQVLAENGFLGLVSFMAIIFYLFYLFIKRGGERGLFPQVVFASLFIFLFDNLNNFSFRVTSLAVIFWIIAGLFLALKERGVTVNRWLKLPAIIIFLLSLYLTINLSFFRLAQNYFLNQNNLKKASQILNVLSQTNPLNPDYLIWQASISLEDNNSEGTIGFLEKAANLEKDNPETYFQIGNLYHKKGENNKARAFLEKTIRLAPFAWPHYYNSLAEVLIDLNQKEEASALLEKAKKQMFPINQKYYSCQSYLNEVGISSQLMSTYLLYQELSP
jgi:tetratricopeptide (TPR) repeat protein